MKVVCVKDEGRPNEIPTTKWVKKGDVYTVIDYIKCNIQGGKIAYILEEIDLSGCEPWKGFSEDRFVPTDWIAQKLREYHKAGEV